MPLIPRLPGVLLTSHLQLQEPDRRQSANFNASGSGLASFVTEVFLNVLPITLLIGDANVPEVTLAHPWVYILTRRLHGTWAVHIRGGLKEINQCNRSAKLVRQLMLNSLIQQYFDCYSVVWQVWVQT